MLKKYLNIEVVENGKMLLEKLEVSEYDIILMDIQMPEMNGIEATKKIRKNRRYDNVKIIGVSAMAFDSDRQKAIKSGMDDYLTKPVRPQELYAVIKKWSN